MAARVPDGLNSPLVTVPIPPKTRSASSGNDSVLVDEAVQDVGSSELFGADVFDDAGIVSDLEALGPLSTIDQALILSPRVAVGFKRSKDRVSLFCRELDESSV